VTQNLLIEPNAWEKLKNIEATCHRLLRGGKEKVPETPGRDVEIRSLKGLPPRRGLSFRDGQARLLHDLASIELQAMELGIRTLAEFRDAPLLFREQLVAVTLEEAKHFRLCLETLENFEYPWGSFPTHIGLWQTVNASDDLIDRILIVHRYLEGSGLDASTQLLNRLNSVDAPDLRKVVSVIANDEIGHVAFGSHWFKELVKGQRFDPDDVFRERMFKLIDRIPRRLEKINYPLREKVGFTQSDITVLEEVRSLLMNSTGRSK
jgi:uncharacterized ferritin-like protein (DUF455 family)